VHTGAGRPVGRSDQDASDCRRGGANHAPPYIVHVTQTIGELSRSDDRVRSEFLELARPGMYGSLLISLTMCRGLTASKHMSIVSP
jgi:hypothetical protein